MDKYDLAKALFGGGQQSQEAGSTTVLYGRAAGDSANGRVDVSLNGVTYASEGAGPSIQMDTTTDVRAGETVIVTVVDGHPVVTGVVGSGDRLRTDVDAAAGVADLARQDVTKALKEIESVKTTYATKSELKATDTELSGRVSDTLTTAKGYTDSSMEREVTARDAAIKAQADSISLDVSRTYTKSETFSAYQTDADGRIATANANSSTAVSTAKTAASDAATAKTNASSAVSTANAASGTASKASTDAAAAVKTANAANGNASSAVSTANGAVSTANAASGTAQTAKSTADTAKSTADSAKAAAGTAQSTADAAKSAAATAQTSADRAQGTADDAWARTLRVQVSSAPADAAGDTSRLTATVWRGGEQLTDEAVARMGLLAWYVGGKRVATGNTYTCAAGTAVECRLEA